MNIPLHTYPYPLLKKATPALPKDNVDASDSGAKFDRLYRNTQLDTHAYATYIIYIRADLSATPRKSHKGRQEINYATHPACEFQWDALILGALIIGKEISLLEEFGVARRSRARTHTCTAREENLTRTRQRKFLGLLSKRCSEVRERGRAL